jgi:hypothetical protein
LAGIQEVCKRWHAARLRGGRDKQDLVIFFHFRLLTRTGRLNGGHFLYFDLLRLFFSLWYIFLK